MDKLVSFLRYPGSKRRMLQFLSTHLPSPEDIPGTFIEPFVGGGAIYFHMRPRTALLADLNRELIDLYEGIRSSPDRVWRLYRNHPNTKTGYCNVRDVDLRSLTSLQRAARSLYLNRTCFKGMWRTNLQGKFNIGYGGQSRRWALSRADLFVVSNLLKCATLRCSDFEPIIRTAGRKDFIFADPPYRPAEKEQIHDHYIGRRFTFDDHKRLAGSLRAAARRGVKWVLTVSSHPAILGLYSGFSHWNIPRGTGRKIGSRSKRSGEVLITNQ